MVDTVHEAMNDITMMLRESRRGLVPRQVIERSLEEKFSMEEIRQAIERLLETTTIDLVVDYPSSDFSLNQDKLMWHLRLLSSAERAELESIHPIQRALIRVLQRTNSEDPGTLSMEDTRAALEAAGLRDDRLQWISVEGRVDTFRTPEGNHMVSCFRLIPECEKTEAYRREREAEEAEWIRTDLERQAAFDKADAEAERRAHRRKKKK